MSKKKHHHEDVQPEAENPLQADRIQIIEGLQLEVERLQTELQEANDKMLRACADSENTQRRAKLDIDNARKFGVEKFAREMLNVVDTLERGLEVTSDSEHQQLENIKQGMELTHKLLLDTMEKFHIQQIDPEGADFDPKRHEALTTQETSEVAPNKVLSVVQKGFAIHDRVLRPARVIVAKAPEDIAN